MHRLLLQFWDRSGVWVVTNRGTRVTARVIQHRAVAVTDTRLPPGACLPVPPGESRVVFRTAERLYRLELTVAQVLRPPPLPASDPGAVVTKGHFSPTQEQIELLTALVEPLVLDPGAEDAAVPTVRRRSSWGRTPRSRRSRSRPGRWRSRRTRRSGGPVTESVDLGPITPAESGSGPEESLRHGFTEGIEEFGLSQFTVNIWDQNQKDLLVYPVGEYGRVAWDIRSAGGAEAVGCRVALHSRDAAGHFLDRNSTEVAEAAYCRLHHGFTFTVPEPGDYTMVLTVDLPGDTPTLCVSQPFRAVVAP